MPLTATRIPPGAPGLYREAQTAAPALDPARMDVAGFVGVAPRGPAREPVIDETWRDDRPCVEPARPRRRSVAVAVDSFDAYRRLFGGFEGPGLLPYAVAAFFDNGGRRAYVVRIVHAWGDAAQDEAGRAQGSLPGFAAAPRLSARNEGSWGNALQVAVSFTVRALAVAEADLLAASFEPADAPAPGSLLRATLADGSRVLRHLVAGADEPDPAAPATRWRALFDTALPLPAQRFELVEASLTLDDGAGLRERFDALGLDAAHPRWLAQVLCYQSQLVWPDPAWAYARLLPADANLLPAQAADFAAGADRYPALQPEDFLDPLWTPAEAAPGQGVCALAQGPELASVVVPDLYSPAPLAPPPPSAAPASLAGAEFAPCVTPTAAPAAPTVAATTDLTGLRLDPAQPAELTRIIALQAAVASFAAATRDCVALLDVPPRLRERELLQWRTRLIAALGAGASHAAAYHPWLDVARRDDARAGLVRIPPAAVAAGILARVELAHGVAWGPANVLAAQVVRVAQALAPAQHDTLHPLGINVFLPARDGVRLSAARTLAAQHGLRQLSVRRFLIQLRRSLLQQMQWAVFEPNGPQLWAQVRQLLRLYLRRQFQAGALRGAREEDAFFVRCDASTHPQPELDAGRMVAEIGVAPAEPLEFIVLRLARGGDGTLTLEDAGHG